jgi:5'-AMP-activated protein kinase regulatory beta subunit
MKKTITFTRRKKMAKKKKKRVIFRVFAPEAQKVMLSGTFNQWSQDVDPMKKDETGTWEKIKILPKGTHQYKFIVDGEWTCDPNCPDVVCDDQGAENNQIVV